MNINQLFSLIRTLLKILGSALTTHGAIKAGSLINTEDVVGLILIFAGIVWSLITHQNVDLDNIENAAGWPRPGGPPQTPPQAGFMRFNLMLLLSALSALVFVVIVGCAAIQPGQDPIVVNTERVQTVAPTTFDVVLGLDDSNRQLWISKAPAFHQFCEWLRQPQTAQLADGTSTNVQRVIAMQLNLDKIKLDYKASKVSSNVVLEAIATLQSAENQANSWMLVLTNDSLPFPVQPPATLMPPIELTPTNH